MRPIMAGSRRYVACTVSGGSSNAASFWAAARGRRGESKNAASRQTFAGLVARVLRSPNIVVFEAVEEGVPTYLVELIAAVMQQPASVVMNIIGVSPTTFRRKEKANEPLPDMAGHRVIGFLRIAATLRRLIDDSGDQEALSSFDLDAWLARWLRQPLPALAGRTPVEMLRNPEGIRAVEQVLERMSGGLAA
jgi:putative toxin-antitoxin system antitoxin component (TIGR02293 family)